MSVFFGLLKQSLRQSHI